MSNTSTRGFSAASWPIRELLPRWERSLLSDGIKAVHVRRYKGYMLTLMRDFDPSATLEVLTVEAVEQHLALLERYGYASLNAFLAISQFCRWCVARGFLAEDPTSRLGREGREKPRIRRR